MDLSIRTATAALTALATLTLATGCNTDFWGNPQPGPSDEGTTCPVGEGPVAPPPPFDPAAQQKPAGVTPGNSWIVFELEVRALDADGNRDYCIPFAGHVYARSGEADTVTLDGAGLPGGPHDFTGTTPWAGRYLALQYNPTEQRFAGSPPAYEVHLDATYLAERDAHNPPPAALRCAIRLRGATVAQDLSVIAKGSNVRCELHSNDYWIHA